MGRLDPGLVAHLNNAAPAPINPSDRGHASTGVGSLLGGVIGTVAGTALLPGLGTVAGGGAGSALGDALEQAIEHNGKVDWGNVGAEGTMGLAGGTAGKLLGAGIKGVRAAQGVNVGLKGLQAADQVAPKAGDLATSLSQLPGKMTAAGKADSAANKLLASQYGTISKPVARSVDLPGTVGKLADYGITKPADAERIANAFTGSDGIVSKGVRSAAGSADRVSTDGVRQIANDAITNNQVTGAKAKGFKDFLDATMNKLSGGPAGTLKPGAHPNDVLDVVKSLESRAADLTGKGGTRHLPTSEDVALAKVHTQVANELKDRLDSSADVNKVLTPAFRDNLVGLHPNNSKWAGFVDNTVMKSKDISQLRSTMSPFVKIGKAIGEADTNSGTFGGQVGKAAVNGRGIVGSVVGATAGSDIAKRAAAGVVKNAGDVVGKAGKVAGVVGSQVLPRAVVGAANPQTPQAASAVAPSPFDAAPVANAQTADNTDQQSSGSFSPAVLQAMALHDIQTTGGKNLAKIQALNSMFVAPSQKNANKSMSDATNKAVGNAQSGLAALDQLTTELKGNPNILNKNAAAGALPGDLGNLARGVAGTQGYEAARKEAMDILARLRTGAAMSKNEERFYANLLPAPGDSPQAAAQKIARYKQEFQGYIDRAQAGNN